MKHSAPPAPRAGFTLVEVLLTLLIMAGIMVSVTEILTAARTSRDEIHNIQERQLAGPAILARIEQDLRALLVYDRDPRLALRVQNRVLSGFDADTIDLAAVVDTTLPFRERPGDPFRISPLNEVGYCLRPRPDSDDFLELYRREGLGIDDKPFQGGHYALLADRVKGFNVEIFDQDGLEAEPVEEWTESADQAYVGIPVRIDIQLTLELAPRLLREQLVSDTRTITYERVLRFPEILRKASELQPRPAIPRVAPVADPSQGGAAGGGAGGPGGSPDKGKGRGGDDGEVLQSPDGGEGGDENPFGGG
jgi:prepilin-type N-terminal cleavage/methylation domain-containing protein